MNEIVVEEGEFSNRHFVLSAVTLGRLRVNEQTSVFHFLNLFSLFHFFPVTAAWNKKKEYPRLDVTLHSRTRVERTKGINSRTELAKRYGRKRIFENRWIYNWI